MSVNRIKAISKKTGKPIKGFDVDVTVTRLDGTKIRKQKRLTGYYKRDADQYESELKAQLMLGDIDGKEEKTVPTLSEFKDIFMKNYVQIRCRPKEQRNKEGHFRIHLLPLLGDKALNQITARDYDDYIAAKRDQLAPKTINGHLSTLNLVLKLAKKYGHIEHVPDIDWLPLIQKERKHLPFEIAEKLIDAADDEWKVMIITALKTGLRMGELLGLLWECVDFEMGYLTVKISHVEGDDGPPKNGKIRRVALGDTVLNALKAHWQKAPQQEKSALVFCRKDGTNLSKNQARRAMQRACKKAGIDHTSWHPLRYSFASHLGQRNAPFQFIRDSMGHSTADMTSRYMKLDNEAAREAAKLLDGTDTTDKEEDSDTEKVNGEVKRSNDNDDV